MSKTTKHNSWEVKSSGDEVYDRELVFNFESGLQINIKLHDSWVMSCNELEISHVRLDTLVEKDAQALAMSYLEKFLKIRMSRDKMHLKCIESSNNGKAA